MESAMAHAHPTALASSSFSGTPAPRHTILHGPPAQEPCKKSWNPLPRCSVSFSEGHRLSELQSEECGCPRATRPSVAENDPPPAQVGLTRTPIRIHSITLGLLSWPTQLDRSTGSSSLFRVVAQTEGACRVSISGPCASGPP